MVNSLVLNFTLVKLTEVIFALKWVNADNEVALHRSEILNRLELITDLT